MPSADEIASELVAPGTLTVCLAAVGPPAASVDDNGQLVGYNLAFANEIAAHMGLDPVIRAVNFSELTSNIQSHACDLSVSSQNITAERNNEMNLIPYTQSKAGFPVVVAKGNKPDIASLTDLCGQAVSAAAGSTSVDAVNGTGDFAGDGINFDCEQTNAPTIDLRTYPTELDAVQALLDGTVVAYLGNANFVAQYPDLLQPTTATLPPARQGIAVASDHPTLTTATAAAMGAMISDGTYLAVLRQYLPSADDVDNFSIIE